MLHAACLLRRNAPISTANIYLLSDSGSTAGGWVAAGASGRAGVGVSAWTTVRGGRGIVGSTTVGGGGGAILVCMGGMVMVTRLTVAGGGAAGSWITGSGGISAAGGATIDQPGEIRGAYPPGILWMHCWEQVD